MKNAATAIALCCFAAGLWGCSEQTYDSYVEGKVVNLRTNDEFDVAGDTLSKTGDGWYGNCVIKDGSISFEVGDDDPTHISGSGQFNINVAGVIGPAQEGVSSETSAINYIDDPDRYTMFDTVVFTNVDEWVVTAEDAEAVPSDNCVVQLFSTPAYGELTPTSHTFDFFVYIDCNGLTGVTPTGKDVPELTGFSAELYFERCD